MEAGTKVNEYIDRVQNAILSADLGQTKLERSQFEVPGMSAPKNRIFLNELIKDGDRYLEIGTYYGSTFIAALYKNNPAYAVAIDNFCQFGGTLTTFMFNCMANNVKDFDFISNDCFNLKPEELAGIKDINVYFYDGEHHHKDQSDALTYYIDTLQDEFIFIVDDWNNNDVKSGTYEGIQKTGVTVHRQWELPAAFNGDLNQWWHGLYVAVCSKKVK